MTAAGERSVVLIGGPAAGKSTLLGALWIALQTRGGLFGAPPANVEHLEALAKHLWQGEFPEPTPNDGKMRYCRLPLNSRPRSTGSTAVVIDVAGQMWSEACEARELSEQWLRQIRESEAALLCVRHEGPNVRPMDFVNEIDEKAMIARAVDTREGPPTDLFLCDMLNLLEHQLGIANGVVRPRMAMICNAWDMRNVENEDEAVRAYLKREFPMLHGRLADDGRLELGFFGISATGGDLGVSDYRTKYRDAPRKAGYSMREAAGGMIEDDLAAPLAWTLGFDRNDTEYG